MITNNLIKINGQAVREQLSAFRKQCPIQEGWSIETQCTQHDSEKAMFKAVIKTPSGQSVATGHACASGASALETAETNAISRALAAAGFIGSEFANVDEPATVKTQGAEPCQTALPPAISQASKAAEPVQQNTQVSAAQSQPKQSEPAKPSQANQPDPEKALAWAKENLEEWLDEPCNFAKAQQRTWRQLAQNIGEKIAIKNKPSQPRAYLHVIENWDSCSVWARVKAQVALQFVKNGNGVAGDYSHPAEA